MCDMTVTQSDVSSLSAHANGNDKDVQPQSSHGADGGKCPLKRDPARIAWLVKRLKEVRGVLRKRGFTDHVIQQAVTILCRRAMPYVNGNCTRHIENRRAWAFRVAIRAANRAARREVRC